MIYVNYKLCSAYCHSNCEFFSSPLFSFSFSLSLSLLLNTIHTKLLSNLILSLSLSLPMKCLYPAPCLSFCLSVRYNIDNAGQHSTHSPGFFLLEASKSEVEMKRERERERERERKLLHSQCSSQK